MEENNKLMLIDGHSILNRAYFGLPHLTAPDGTPTGAVYGFLNIMFKFLDDEAPDHLAVAFDLSAPTFRHKAYKDYKGTRKPMDEDLKVQVPLIKDILKTMNIPVVTQEGYEADDIIGTLSKNAGDDGMNVVIVSGDKDLLQLVDEKVTVKNPKTSRGVTTVTDYTPEKVQEEYGVTTEEFVLLKAIMGDTSDNIPGVKGVGPKTAAPIVAQYHTLESVIEHIPDLRSESLKKKMNDGIESMKMSYFLASIDREVPLEFKTCDAKLTHIFTPEAHEVFKKYNFRSLLKRFDDNESSVKNEDFKIPDAVIIDEKSKAKELFTDCRKILGKGSSIGISVQAADKSESIIAFLTGDLPEALLICTDDDSIYKIIPGDDLCAEDIKDMLVDLAYFKHNEKSDGHIYINDLKKAVKVLGDIDKFPFEAFDDVALMAYIADPVAGKYEYSDIAAVNLSASLPDKKELKGDPGTISINDAYVSYKAGPVLLEKLYKTDQFALYETIERPLVPVLADMEKQGVRADREALKEYSGRLSEKIEELTKTIYDMAGETFNINSPKILGNILFDKLGLPHGKKTKTGYSTAAEVLEKLALEHPIAEAVTQYRLLSKLKSTYAEGLSAFIGEDGRIHGDFNQTVTATGRLSSANPNLQNIPVRMDIGREIRKVFTPGDGWLFVDADYSQIELRVLAHMSGDEKLIEAYNHARDIHTMTASRVFNVPFDEVTPQQRRNAKAVNFGIIYGISSFGLGKDLSISTKEAKEYIDSYFKTFPGIKGYLDGLVGFAREKGYSETLYGRKRPVPELKSSNFQVRSFGERIAMNAPIQGTAADIMKLAMIRMYKALKKEGLRSKLILQVHDELIIETAPDEIERVKEILTEAMVHAADLKVPLEIDINVGKNWFEAH